MDRGASGPKHLRTFSRDPHAYYLCSSLRLIPDCSRKLGTFGPESTEKELDVDVVWGSLEREADAVTYLPVRLRSLVGSRDESLVEMPARLSEESARLCGRSFEIESTEICRPSQKGNDYQAVAWVQSAAKREADSQYGDSEFRCRAVSNDPGGRLLAPTQKCPRAFIADIVRHECPNPLNCLRGQRMRQFVVPLHHVVV